MKYYFLNNNNLNNKETGTQFQSLRGNMGDIQKDILPFEGKISFDFILPEPILEKKAIKTSYLNVIFIPKTFLVLKNDFISFLEDNIKKVFQKWNLHVHQNGEIINEYSLFYLFETKQREVVIFEKSKFYLGKMTDQNYTGNIIDINNYEEYLKERKKIDDLETDLILKHNEIILDFSKQNNDLIRLINSPCGGYYISENLKIKIEEKGFTGMLFKEIEEMDNRIKVIY